MKNREELAECVAAANASPLAEALMEKIDGAVAAATASASL